jgi:uncharacterized protein (UPF0276 family)
MDFDPSIQIKTGLAVTYEGREPRLLERLAPLVDYLEITPDSLAISQGERIFLDPAILSELRNVADQVQFIIHGVGLSIASHEGYSEAYLRLVDEFLEHFPAVWHSEHLGYTMVDGENLGTMLAVPKTQQMLELVCERVAAIRQRYHLPFLLENIVHLLPDYPGDYSEAGFLNALSQQADCGLLLDVYNLECDAHNQGFDIPAFLDELHLENVREIHMACGVEHNGFLVDVHSRLLRPSTIELARQAVERANGSVWAVNYELLPEAIPLLGHDAVVGQVERLGPIFCSA